MRRWLIFIGCALAGIGLVALAWVLPAHLRAVDTRVLRTAGVGSPSLPDHGQQLIRENKATAAQLLLAASQQAGVPANSLALSLQSLPPGQLQSAPAMLSSLQTKASGSETVAEIVIKAENRSRTLQNLKRSRTPVIEELLESRSLTNTTLLPESSSSSGQAFDAAVIVASLLIEEHWMTPGLSNAVYELATGANHGANSQRYEQLLLDFLSLSHRLTWDQLTVLLANLQDAETLRHMARLVRTAEGNVPVIFAAVRLSGDPKLVTDYLMNHSQSGITDLRAVLKYRAEGVREFLARNLPLYDARSGWYQPTLDRLAWQSPQLALLLKWFLYLVGGFFLAMGVHYILPVRGPAPVRGLHFAREFLFALGFLTVILLVREPYLAQETQKTEFPFKVRLSLVTGPAPSTTGAQSSSFMNKLSLLTLLLFFVLQSLIYVACLVKLAEIRRQRLSPNMKLKLLDNEDHLFDAGLYVGFVGTIISLILVSLGVIKPSLMAAYSSTSFGILFVSVFKIFNLRPVRRRLLMDAEAGNEPIPVQQTRPSTYPA